MRRALITVAMFALVTVGVPLTTSQAAEPPPNDDFANAQVLSGDSLTYSQSTIGATTETDEPNHAGWTGGRSVWFSWTAPRSQSVSIDTCGGDPDLDTLLAVYTGASLAALSEVASNDDDPGCASRSRVDFVAVSGQTYMIAVDDWYAVGGAITLTLVQAPAVGELDVARQVDFGRIRDGLSTTRDIVLTNTGDGSLVIDDVRLRVYSFASGEWSIVSDNATGATIAPGASRTVTIRFRPSHSASGRPAGVTGDAFWLDDLSRISVSYVYSGASPWGVRAYHLVRNAGGRGTVSWAATAGNTDAGYTTESGSRTGSEFLLAGEYYAVGVRSPYCVGNVDQAYQTWGFDSFESNWLFQPTVPGGTVRCMEGPDSVAFYRLGDAALVIQTTSPILHALAIPYVTDPDDSPWTAVVLLGEGKAYCPGYAGDSRNQIVGTGAGDMLVGTAGPDIICGLGGRDVLRGNGGTDLLVGGGGTDKLFGGGGNDTLLAKDGKKDVLNGGAGRDIGAVDRYDVWKSVEVIRH